MSMYDPTLPTRYIQDATRPFTMIQNDLVLESLPIIGTYAFSIYCYLKMRANQHDQCYPSYERISQDTGISRSKVQESIQTLIDNKLLTIEKRQTDTFQQRTNLYTIYDPCTATQPVPVPPHGIGFVPEPVPPHGNKQYKENKQEPVIDKVRQKTRSQVPVDWQPSENGRAHAKALGVSLEDQLDQFIDHHRSKGNTFLDIDAAWRTWCRNAARWNKPHTPTPPAQPKSKHNHMTPEELIGFTP